MQFLHQGGSTTNSTGLLAIVYVFWFACIGFRDWHSTVFESSSVEVRSATMVWRLIEKTVFSFVGGQSYVETFCFRIMGKMQCMMENGLEWCGFCNFSIWSQVRRDRYCPDR